MSRLCIRIGLHDTFKIKGYTNTDILLGKLVVFHLYIMLCKNMLVATNGKLQSYNGLFNKIIIALLAIVYAVVFVKIEYLQNSFKLPQDTLIVIVLLAAHIAATMVLVSGLLSNAGVSGDIRTFLSYCLPLFVLISMMNDPGILMELMYRWRGIIFIFSTIGCVMYEHLRTESGMYGMSYGYSAMFVCLVFIYCFVKYKKKKDLLCATAVFIYTFLIGSRGPLYFIAVTLMVLVLFRMKGKMKLYMIMVGVSFILLLFPIYGYLQAHFNELRSFAGYFSRNLAMALDNTMFDDSGRWMIYEVLLNAIHAHPFLGLGAFGGSRVVFLSHNLFYDIIAVFGYPIGICLMLYIFYNTFVLLRKYIGTDLGDLIMLCAVIGLSGGFFTGEFYQDKELWMLFGVFIACRKRSALKKDGYNRRVAEERIFINECYRAM